MLGDSYWASGNNTLYRLDVESGEVVDQLDLVGFGPIPAAGDLWTVDFLSEHGVPAGRARPVGPGAASPNFWPSDVALRPMRRHPADGRLEPMSAPDGNVYRVHLADPGGRSHRARRARRSLRVDGAGGRARDAPRSCRGTG